MPDRRSVNRRKACIASQSQLFATYPCQKAQGGSAVGFGSAAYRRRTNGRPGAITRAVASWFRSASSSPSRSSASSSPCWAPRSGPTKSRSRPSGSCSRARCTITASACCARSMRSPTPKPPTARSALDFDIEWVQVYVGQRLQSYFDHHFVFVADPSDRLLYATLGSARVDPNWFNSVRADLNPALDQLRGRSHSPCRQRARRRRSAARRRRRASASTRLQTFLGRPAILGAVAIASSDDLARNSAEKAPIVMSVKLIDSDVLAEIASHLQLRNLRQVSVEPIARRRLRLQADRSAGPAGRDLRMDAQAARRRNRQQRHSVHRRRARRLRAARRARAAPHAPHRSDHRVGRNRLRHLALHDPLCGLPNRIFFGERLEAVIADVQQRRPAGGGALHRPRSLQGRQRHARPSDRRRTASAT